MTFLFKTLHPTLGFLGQQVFGGIILTVLPYAKIGNGITAIVIFFQGQVERIALPREEPVDLCRVVEGIPVLYVPYP